MRALRPGKLNLAALEATLLLYLDEDRLRETVPLLAMLTASEEELKTRAQTLCNALGALPGVNAEIKQGESYSGGGSLPDEAIPTWLVTVRTDRCSPDQIATKLRAQSPPVIARIADEAIILDLRTLSDEDSDEIAIAFQRIQDRP